MKLFTSKKPQYEALRKKWVQRQKVASENLFSKHLHRVALGSLGGLMLLSSSGMALKGSNILANTQSAINADKDNSPLLAAALKDSIPSEVQPLTPTQEQSVSTVLTQTVGAPVSAELGGIRLNTDYGLIGGEQNLYRYPGDTIYAQLTDARDWAMYGSSGMAPNLGAWGYFAPSREQITPEDVAREKYYIAVQTFLAPGFAENVAQYRDFFKYRKMVVVNPQTGQAVVADIADAGPSPYTGKQLGGSPEVMNALGLGSGPRKGAVLYFFIDDPNDTIPLGPIKVPDSLGTKQS